MKKFSIGVLIMIATTSFAISMKEKEELVLDLYDAGVVKFGNFTLQTISGSMETPIYVDLRLIISHPELFNKVTSAMHEQLKNADFSMICGVPVAALPMATSLAIQSKSPMVLARKTAKDYGTRKLIEGAYDTEDSCVVIEDVIVSGASILETISTLKHERIGVHDIIIFFDRQQGGCQRLADLGYKVHTVLNMNELLSILYKHGRINQGQVDTISHFIESNQT